MIISYAFCPSLRNGSLVKPPCSYRSNLFSFGEQCESADCVIVGGGISGLSIAHALLAKLGNVGQNVIVAEAADRAGGAISTVEKDGYRWEVGPNSFSPSDHVLSMVLEYGLMDELILGDPKAPRYVYWNERLRSVPSKITDLPFFDLMSAEGKARACLGALGFRPPPPGNEESVEEFVSRNLGKEAFERLVEPFCSGVYAGDPSKLSMKAAFANVWKLEVNGGSILGGALKAIRKRKKFRKTPRDKRLPKIKGQTVGSFKKGISTLSDAMARRLDHKIKYCWRLTNIMKMNSGEYKLSFDTRQGVVSLQTKCVVLTVPSYTASNLLYSLSPVAAEALSEIEYPPVAVVAISYPMEAIRASRLTKGKLRGFGQLHPRGQGLSTLGTIYRSSLFPDQAPPGRVLLVSFIGGATNPEVLSKSESELVEMTNSDLRKMLINTNAEDPLLLGVKMWPKAIPQFVVGHLDRIDTAKRALKESALDGIFLGGSYVSGVALGRCIEGAFEVANEMADFLP